MKILNETTMQNLSFPDMRVEKMEFFPQKKILNIFVEGAFLDVNKGGLLGKGVVHFNEWEFISIRRYDSFLEKWQAVHDDIEPEQLKDLCEVKFCESEVSLCGFGKTIGQWLEWKIIKTKMSAEFEDEYNDDGP